MKLPAIFLLAAAVGMSISPPASAKDKFVTIGTAAVTGVYYPAGGAICRFLNADNKNNHIKCTVESTGGSVYNLDTIRAGDMTLGISQSDTLYKAYNGKDRWEKKPFKDVRALFALHPEVFTLVARDDSGIQKLSDIKGKRVQVGVPGSGTIEATRVVLAAAGMSMDDLALAAKLKPAEQSSALCDNQIDAFIYVVGHPAATIQEATTTCDSHIVTVPDDIVDQLVKKYSYYGPATIPGGMYDGNPDPIKTFGMRAVVVGSTDTAEETVYQTVKAVFDNLDRFKSLHPAFKILDKKEMTEAGIPVPLHDGAIRYYKEAGLMD